MILVIIFTGKKNLSDIEQKKKRILYFLDICAEATCVIFSYIYTCIYIYKIQFHFQLLFERFSCVCLHNQHNLHINNIYMILYFKDQLLLRSPLTFSIRFLNNYKHYNHNNSHFFISKQNKIEIISLYLCNLIFTYN